MMDMSDGEPRPLVCLVADLDALDRFPAALRYLQLGLSEEPFDVALIVPESRRATLLSAGPTTVFILRDRIWPLSMGEHRRLIRTLGDRFDPVRSEVPVVVHALTIGAATLAAEIAEAFDGELVVTLSSHHELTFHDLPRLSNRAWMLVGASEAMTSALAARSPSARATRMIPFGAAASRAQAAFARPDRAPTLVFAGPLDGECGGDVLLNAVKRVLSSHDELSLFIMGKGPAEDDLRQIAESLGIRPLVTFTGRLDNFAQALDAADVFCVAGPGDELREEPLTALARGVTVLAPLRNLYDGLVDGETALLFPRDDADALALRIDHCLREPQRARSIAAAGQAYIRAQLPLSRMVSEYARLYQDAAARHRTLSLPKSP